MMEGRGKEGGRRERKGVREGGGKMGTRKREFIANFKTHKDMKPAQKHMHKT